MKRIILVLTSTILCLIGVLQAQETRKIQVFSGGKVIFTRDVKQVDSINFLLSAGSGEEPGEPGEIDDTSSIYVGVVAFNDEVYQLPITSNLEATKSFINMRNNNTNGTSFAYSVSKGNLMFDASGLPTFDKIFMLNFSDGTDNRSSGKWLAEGRLVGSNYVYDTARYDLLQREDLNSYALGFGAEEVNFREKMKKVVMGNGSYHSATTSAQLQPTFNQVANAIIASAQNITLQTMAGYYVGEENYKYFRFIFTATRGSELLKDTVWARLEGENTTGFKLTVTKSGQYARFDDTVRIGSIALTEKLVILPLKNLKFVVAGEELQFEFSVEVSVDGENFYVDVEDASMAKAVSKRLAVVLVLDCSTSMGDAFEPMKEAAIDFIETLENKAGSQGSGGGSTGSRSDYVENGGNLSLNLQMVKVEGGTFTMGATSEQGSSYGSDERPTHSVTLTGYHISKYEITQAQWKAVMGMSPSYFTGDNLPVENITWYQAKEFCDKLSEKTGKKYALPTEAQWEFAARGGVKSKGYKYSGSNTIDDVAWYYSNSSSKTHEVGTKAANELGIYDMSGNVLEWCADWYGAYSSDAVTDPTGPNSGNYRVLRGGSWFNYDIGCRVSYRFNYYPGNHISSIGFRVVCLP